MNTKHFLTLLAVPVLLGWGIPAHAQWITQTNRLIQGWNGVYLHVDGSHTTVDDLVSASPIEEIWLWRPALSSAQFIDSPSEPSESDARWIRWSRAAGPASALDRLIGNAAYLVRLSSNVTSHAWSVKGKPLPSANRWETTGLNFVGFATPSVSPPTFHDFLAPVPELRVNAEIFAYMGGELSSGNPMNINGALRSMTARRDQAFWIRSGDYYNRYYGPFELVVRSTSGINFRDTSSQSSVRLKNLTATPLTVTLEQIASEPSPPGQASIAGQPPLIVRGELNTTNLTYTHTSLLDGPLQWVLSPQGEPGSEVEVVVGLDRTQMGVTPGDLYAGLLRVTDSLNLSQVDVGVSAQVATTAGLWVGDALVTGVSASLTRYTHVPDTNAFQELVGTLSTNYTYQWDSNSTRILVFGGPDGERKFGAYLTEDNGIESTTVHRPFPLRLILHNDGVNSHLLQRVYYGPGAGGSPVVATEETLLDPTALDSALRISAIHLPTSAPDNVPWLATGAMVEGGSLTTTVTVAYDDQRSNPFLHTYHPDHDNLNASFDSTLDRGSESYQVDREITLIFTPPPSDFNSLTAGSQLLSGSYQERITMSARDRKDASGIVVSTDSKSYEVNGSFALRRISDIGTLTTHP